MRFQAGEAAPPKRRCLRDSEELGRALHRSDLAGAGHLDMSRERGVSTGSTAHPTCGGGGFFSLVPLSR